MNAIDLMATSLADQLGQSIRDFTKGLRTRERKEVVDRALAIVQERRTPKQKEPAE